MNRVSPKAPCLICGGKTWCGLSDDGALAICMRLSEGAISDAQNGGHVHILHERERADWQAPMRPSQPAQLVALAPIARRHAAYSALIDALTLDGRHANNLLARGLSDTEAARLLYASLPDLRAGSDLCADLFGQFDLEGVPGFFRGERGRWQLAAWSSGFFVPVRDAQGRIQACQIRFDEGLARYAWLSSKGRNGGASSGAPVHFARPWRVASTGEALITEGALKADLIAEKLDCCVVAVAGVANFKDDFGQWLRGELPDLRNAIIALDSDWHSKPEVERAMLRLLTSIERTGLGGGLFDWSSAKGLDDLLSEEVVNAQ